MAYTTVDKSTLHFTPKIYTGNNGASLTISANTTGGFSIIKFTGNSSTSQSFGHGLNGTPKIWFIKNISVGGDNWQVYIDGRRLKLDTTEAAESNYLMSANSTTITTPSSGELFCSFAIVGNIGFDFFGL